MKKHLWELELETREVPNEKHVDCMGKRWFVCAICNRFVIESDVWMYGGELGAGRGICNEEECIQKHKERKSKAEPVAKAKITKNDRVCPLCGKKLIIRMAKNGPNKGKQFLGCSGFYENGCRYTRSV